MCSFLLVLCESYGTMKALVSICLLLMTAACARPFYILQNDVTAYVDRNRTDTMLIPSGSVVDYTYEIAQKNRCTIKVLDTVLYNSYKENGYPDSVSHILSTAVFGPIYYIETEVARHFSKNHLPTELNMLKKLKRESAMK